MPDAFAVERTKTHLAQVAGQSLGGYGSPAYQSFVLNGLFLIYVLNFIDRGLLSVVSEFVIAEFKLSDFQYGLLGGPAFAIFYSLVGIPVASASERRSRVAIISVCVGLWSLATALCGAAQALEWGALSLSGFGALFLCRMLVGIGEAGCTPPASSLIADYFAPSRRSAAMGFYTMGVPIGGIAANLIGGPLVAAIGWRAAFMVVGLSGFLIAIIFRLCVAEPPRGGSSRQSDARPAAPVFLATLRELAGKPTFVLIATATAFYFFFAYGFGIYQTSFVRRTFLLSQTEATLFFNVPIALASSIGIFLTGWIAGKIQARHPSAIIWLPATGLLLAVPLYLIAFTTDGRWIAFACLAAAAVVKNGTLAAVYIIAQGVTGAHGRATATAIVLLIGSLLGTGAGPPVVGWVSDAFFRLRSVGAGFSEVARESCRGSALHQLPDAAQAFCRSADALALQQTLVLLSFLLVAPALFFLLARRTLKADWVSS